MLSGKYDNHKSQQQQQQQDPSLSNRPMAPAGPLAFAPEQTKEDMMKRETTADAAAARPGNDIGEFLLSWRSPSHLASRPIHPAWIRMDGQMTQNTPPRAKRYSQQLSHFECNLPFSSIIHRGRRPLARRSSRRRRRRPWPRRPPDPGRGRGRLRRRRRSSWLPPGQAAAETAVG